VGNVLNRALAAIVPELKRRRPNFFVGDRRREIEEHFDIATHR
jgi:hypothetical protein